ncbi:MAG TPA: hypothetical protein VKV16_10930, partial [Solirubrobacteraceae bacterium]|nr:hypothetical protein [Solirubrobacteraceae bacterium]
AGARRQLIGVSDASFLERMAGALALLGVDRALLVAAQDGLDEVSASAPTTVFEVNGEEIVRYVLEPHEVGVHAPEDPRAQTPAGGTPAQNAALTRAILRSDGGREDAPRDGDGDGEGGREDGAASDGEGDGRRDDGDGRDLLAGEALAVINAGAAIYAAGGAESIAQGVEAAHAAIADGRAASALERYVQASRRHAREPARADARSSR